MVPSGWTQGKVKDLIKSLDAGVSVNSDDDGNLEAEFKILKTSCVSGSSFDFTKVKSVIIQSEIDRLKEPVLADSIIVSRMNTPALVGANGYVENEITNTYLPDRLWQLKPYKGKVSMRWLGYWFASSPTRHQLSATATGTSGSMKNITKTDVLNININIPPLPEQQKIAKILTTWDKAINTTERLIENSKQQKKALMQQLLTGQKRLLDDSGQRFSGDWKDAQVSDYFEVGSSKRVLQEDWQESGVPFYRTRELVSLAKKEPFSSSIFISEKHYKDLIDKYGMPSEDDFLVSGVGTLGIIYQVKNGDKFYFKDGNVLWFKKKSEVSSDFFKYMFLSDFVQHQIDLQSSVTTVGTYTIKNAKVTKFLCPPIQEQQKIAAVLTTADREIEVLEQQLADLQQEKKALMQQLLTGKKRVLVDK